MLDQHDIHMQWILFALAVVCVLLTVLGNKTGIPLLGLSGRWLRWLLFSALFALFLEMFEISMRPHLVHLITGAALWFMLVTGYNWVAIKALSHSELPLFPQFYENKDGDEWPAEKRFIDLKDWLRSQNYSRLSPLKAELFEGTYLRASIYECVDSLTRIQILFLPKQRGGTSACYTISTHTESGERIITDNMYLPFGGYYPSSWHMCRKPIVGSLPQLFKIHQRRLSSVDSKPVAIEDDALEEMNDQQRILERHNTTTGFLVPRQNQEEEGKISADGRYRLWKEMWFLAYFGKSVV